MLKMIIWDADGVLLNSHLIDLQVYKEIAKRSNFPFDQNLAETLLQEDSSFETIITKLWNVDFNKKLELSKMFTSISNENAFLSKFKLFEGIKPLIEKISSNYIIQNIATARNSDLMQKILNHTKITEIRHIRSSSDLLKNDKTEILKYLLSNHLGTAFKVLPQDCLFITDSVSDIIAGSKLGIPTVGIKYGYTDTETITRANPTFTVESVAELDSFLTSLIDERKTQLTKCQLPDFNTLKTQIGKKFQCKDQDLYLSAIFTDHNYKDYVVMEDHYEKKTIMSYETFCKYLSPQWL